MYKNPKQMKDEEVTVDKNLREEALALAKDIATSAVASVEGNRPWIRIMSQAKIDDDFTLWYATFSFSNKIRQFEKNSAVCVVLNQDPFDLRLFGKVEIVADQTLKNRMWRDQWMKNFKGGREDPTYTLFKVIPERIEYRNFEKYGPVAKEIL
jgi:general stress protein 26